MPLSKYFHANSTEEDSLAVGEDSLAMGAKTVVNGNAGIGIGLNILGSGDAIKRCISLSAVTHAQTMQTVLQWVTYRYYRGGRNMTTPPTTWMRRRILSVNSVGSEDGQRQITNVAAGSADTDAVNVGQLKVTDERVAQNTQSITNLNNQVTNLDTRVTNIENGYRRIALRWAG